MISYTSDYSEVAPWVCARAGGEPGVGTGIGMKKDGEMVGGVLYDNFNGASIMAHIALDHPVTKRLLFLMFDYPFTQLNVNAIIIAISSANTAANRFASKLGFKLQATLKKSAPDGDLILYQMLRENCRFLEVPHGKAIGPATT